MVVQPLFRKLNSENILHRAYYKDGNQQSIILEISTKTKPYYAVNKDSQKVLLSGVQNLAPDLVYELFEDHYEVISNRIIFNRLKMRKLEMWLDEVYTFRDTHKVTEYK